MRRPQGYAVTIEPDRPTIEQDTFTCGHCNAIVFLSARQDPSAAGGMCRLCMRHVCERCAAGACTPFERRLEEMERRDGLLRAMGVG